MKKLTPQTWASKETVVDTTSVPRDLGDFSEYDDASFDHSVPYGDSGEGARQPEETLPDAASSASPKKGRSKGVNVGETFTKIPGKLLGSGTGRKLGPCAGWLYITLCEKANNEGGNTFSARDKDLAWETGLGLRTIKRERVKLSESGLVRYSRPLGKNYTYVILPQDLKWTKKPERLPPPEKRQRVTTAPPEKAGRGAQSGACGAPVGEKVSGAFGAPVGGKVVPVGH
jgi:hypothetical protein